MTRNLTNTIYKQDHMLLTQFEKTHYEKVANWLVVDLNYSKERAQALSDQIFSHLKIKFKVERNYHTTVLWTAIQKIAKEELNKEKSRMHKNFGLTEAAFNDLLISMQKGDNALFENIFLVHFDDCMNYLKRKYQATHEDAYDASMDTLLEFAKRLRDGKINNL